jgi:signal transduction histidine kinase
MEAWQKLTRVLTHEIMNSVAPISSLAATADQLIGKDLITDGSMPSSLRDVQEAVRIIERRSEALMHFVDAYRSFTRLPTPVFEMISARELLNRVRGLLNTELETKSITCEIHIDPEGLILTADPELVEQVLINLLLNAAEAVEGRSGAQIVLRAQADERGVPMVQVCDNGDGIPLDLQDQIFVPFFTTKENGSGIGLSLSRQIMRLHGGTLSLQSEPGKGAIFTLRF